jgi:hypothetical protein
MRIVFYPFKYPGGYVAPGWTWGQGSDNYGLLLFCFNFNQKGLPGFSDIFFS